MGWFDNVVSGVSNAAKSVAKTTTSAATQVAKPFGNNGIIANGAKSLAMPVFNGLTHDVPNALADVGKGVGSVVSVLGGTAKDILGGVSGLAKGIGSIGQNFEIILIGGMIIAVIMLIKR